MEWKVLYCLSLLLLGGEARWLLDRICDYDLSDPHGVIVSPNYPHSYPSSVSCTYRINVGRGKAVTLSISDVDFGRNSSDGCSGRLDVYDGWDETSARTEAICGTNYFIPGRVINSTTNVLFLKFDSYQSNEGNRGFHALYSSHDVRCGEFLTANNGIIRHPSNGTYYTNNENCTWVIQAPASNIVNITFTRFATETNFDYLQIREVYQGKIYDVVRLTGIISSPRSVVTRERVMILNFRSDSSNVQTGFNGAYTFVDVLNKKN